MKTTRQALQILALTAVLAIGIVSGFNCARQPFSVYNDFSSGNIDDLDFEDLDDSRVPPAKPGVSTALLMTEQVYYSMLAATGVQSPSSTVRNSYEAKKALFAEVGKVQGLNAPMLMSIANLAGEICAQAVTQEKALAANQRQLFGALDFSRGPASITQTNLGSTIESLSRSMWGRLPTDDDAQGLADLFAGHVSALTQAQSQDRNQTDLVAIALCTAALASQDAWTF